MRTNNVQHTVYNVGILSDGEAKRAMARDQGRCYLLVANHDSTVGLWLHIGNTTPGIETGGGMIYLAPGGGYYEREGDLCPDEALWLVAESGDTFRYTLVGGRYANK